MSLFDCDYCGTRIEWRPQDVPPLKCWSCGAPRQAPRYGGATMPMKVIYGLACLRSESYATLYMDPGEPRIASDLCRLGLMK